MGFSLLGISYPMWKLTDTHKAANMRKRRNMVVAGANNTFATKHLQQNTNSYSNLFFSNTSVKESAQS